MRHPLRTTVCALAALSLLATVEADAARQTIGVMKTRNKTEANRSFQAVDRVVIHVTEGSFWGSVRWLRNPRAHGSSHYVVSRTGKVVQLVDVSDIAWHAGNRATNERSIGIEHEGFTARGGFTRAQYRASARLLAYLSKRAGFPLDRRHVIGHDAVPHPSGQGVGGIDHHTDPGQLWNWRRYLSLARAYKRQPQRPRLVRMKPPAEPAPASRGPRVIRCGRRQSVHSLTLYRGQTVAGRVRWRAKACGRRISRVEFLVDGKVVGRDSVWPYSLGGGSGLNTTKLANGWHTLALRAHGRRGHRVRRLLRVKIANVPFEVRARGIQPGQSVRGLLQLDAATTARARRVQLFVDGTPVDALSWDSATVENGEHELALRAKAVDGREASVTVPVLVANDAPDSEPPPHVVWSSLAPWQTVEGPVAWSVLTEGAIEQVEFWVDGRLRSRTKDVPYTFGWKPKPGAHQLLVRAVGTGGRVAESRAVVFAAR